MYRKIFALFLFLLFNAIINFQDEGLYHFESTNKGDILMKLTKDKTPNTVASILFL